MLELHDSNHFKHQTHFPPEQFAPVTLFLGHSGDISSNTNSPVSRAIWGDTKQLLITRDPSSFYLLHLSTSSIPTWVAACPLNLLNTCAKTMPNHILFILATSTNQILCIIFSSTCIDQITCPFSLMNYIFIHFFSAAMSARAQSTTGAVCCLLMPQSSFCDVK